MHIKYLAAISLVTISAASVLFCADAFAGNSVNLAPLPMLRFVNNNGNSCSGCQLFTYAAGTGTKLAAYTDSTGATPQTNPIVLDARGEAPVWLNSDAAYKIVLSPPTDSDPPSNAIWTVDNLSGAFVSACPTVAQTSDASCLLMHAHNSTATANDIYRMTTNAPVFNFDTIRAVATAIDGGTVTNVTGVASYALNQTASSNTVLFFGAGVGSLNSSSTWGINTVLTDNESYAASSATGKTLYGQELDFNNTSSGTNVVGSLYTGASLAQPNLSIGIHFTPLDVINKRFPWSIAYETDDAAATTAAQFGALAVAGSNVASQPVKWVYYDASAQLRSYSIQANTAQELQFANQVFPGQFAFFGDISLSAMSPPATPPAGRFFLYMSTGDSKLHALGPFGTDTILANP